MSRIAVLLLATLAHLAPGLAAPLSADSRIETVEWKDGSEIPLRTTSGGHIVLIFAPGEAVRTVLVGDPGAVEVKVAPQADSVSIFTARQPADTSIKIQTQLRSYRFNLAVGPANNVAYAVRFSIAVSKPLEQSPVLSPPEASNTYSIKGRPDLRPSKVSDDGQKTYIEWGPDQALPAVFAINALGQEETVDSYMRGGVMVIDRVYPQLRFRIGKHSAVATRATLESEKRR